MLWCRYDYAMQVNLLGSEVDKRWRDIVKLMQRCKTTHELLKVFRRSRCDALCHCAVHAKERNDVHLVAGDVNVDLYLSSCLSETCNVL